MMRKVLIPICIAVVLFLQFGAPVLATPAMLSLDRSRWPSDQALGNQAPQPVGMVAAPSAALAASCTAKDTLPASVLPAARNTFTLSLPVVLQCFKPMKIAPFGVTIAALHQITSTTAATGQVGALTGDQYRAHLDAAFPTLVEALRDSGAGWTRLYLQWQEIERNAPIAGIPVYDWSWYDPKVQAISGAGVQIVATVGSPPAWAAGSTQCGPFLPGRQADFIRFLKDLVTRYKYAPYNVKHWEIVNEPDYAYPTDALTRGFGCWGNAGPAYAQMLAQAYQAIKSVDPQATVIIGGLAYDAWTEYPDYNPRGFYRYFIDDVMKAGGGASADAFAIHYFPDWHAEWERWVDGSVDRQNQWLYAPACGNPVDNKDTRLPPLGPQRYEPWGFDLTAKVTHFRERMQTCFASDKPLWVTELAQHGYPDKTPTETDQARYVIQGITRGLAGGATNVMWYALSTPGDSYQQQLLRDDLSPKPGFYAFKTLATELKDYRYARTMNAAGVEAYVFAAPCATDKIVAWGRDAGTLSLTAKHLRVVDRMGNASGIADGGTGDQDHAVNGSITVALTVDPVIIQVVAAQ
jgi:hypothetical protein